MDSIKPVTVYSKDLKPMDVSENDIPTLVIQGKAGFADTDQIPVVSPDGKYGVVPGNKAAEALAGGYRLDTAADRLERAERAEYSGVVPAVEAAALGTLSGGTLGLSNLALTKTGLVAPETLQKLEKYQKGAYTGGTVVGSLAPVAATILSGGAAAPVEAGIAATAKSALAKTLAYAPANVAAKAGAAVTRGMTGIVGSEGAKSAAKQILGSALSQGAGSAVEGAIYAAGQTLDESVIGHPDDVAEHIFSDVGLKNVLMGAAVGGALGGAIGAAEKGAAKAFGKKPFVSQVDKPVEMGGAPLTESDVIKYGVAPDTLEYSLRANGASDDAIEGIISGKGNLKKNAGEVEEAGRILGAPVMEGQTSASKHVQDTDSWITNRPDPVGVARQEKYSQGFQRAEMAVDHSLGTITPMSEAQAGEQLEKMVTAKIDEARKPISRLYEIIREKHDIIDVYKGSVESLANEVKKQSKEAINNETRSILRNTANKIKNIKTVDDIKLVNTELYQSASATASLETKGAIHELSERLKDLEETNVIHFARDVYQGDKNEIYKLIDMRKEANAKYKALREDLTKLAKGLRMKFSTPQSLLDHIAAERPEAFVRKLFAKDDSRFLKFFAEKFPEEMKTLTQYKLSSIRSAAMKDGSLDLRQIFGEFDKFSPELKKIIMNPEQRRFFDAAKTWVESVPKNINASGTDKSAAYTRFFTSPVKATVETGQTLAAQARMKASADADKAPLFSMFMTIEKTALGKADTVASSIKSFFNSKVLQKSAVPASVGVLRGFGLFEEKRKRKPGDLQSAYQRRFDALSKAVSNPDQLAHSVGQSLGTLSQMAPNISGSLTQKTVQVAQFLYDKAPKNPVAKHTIIPDLHHWRPSDAQIAQWERYVAAAEDPASVVHDMKHGQLTVEGVEAMKTLYPRMYQSVAQSITEHLASLKTDLPYKKKLQLGLFFGANTDPSLDPAFIQRMQGNHVASQNEEANKQAVEKLNIADNLKSSTERTLTRA